MVRKAHEQSRTKVVEADRRSRQPKIDQEEEKILRLAQTFLMLEAKCPILWTVAGIREEKGADGLRRWIIAVHLRYPTGHEGLT